MLKQSPPPPPPRNVASCLKCTFLMEFHPAGAAKKRTTVQCHPTYVMSAMQHLSLPLQLAMSREPAGCRPARRYARGARVGGLPLTSALTCARVDGGALTVFPPRAVCAPAPCRRRDPNMESTSVAMTKMGTKMSVGGSMVMPRLKMV